MARPCSVPGCDITVSESQDFCARCWNNVSAKDQYIVQAAREQLQDAQHRLLTAMVRARTAAAQRIYTG